MTYRTGSAGPEAQAQAGARPELTSFTIRAIEPSGFPVELTFTGGHIESIARIAIRLLELGYGPEERAAQPARPAQASGPPMCPVHRKPMKAMQRTDSKGRTHWCTQKTGDDYCTERA